MLPSGVIFTSESTHVALITLEDRNVPRTFGTLVVSVVGSCHLAQGTMDTGGLEFALTVVEVWHEECANAGD